MELAAPGAAGGEIGLGAPYPPERFVEPMPDSRLLLASDPAERLVERETIRLAFVAALQHLTPPQRSAPRTPSMPCGCRRNKSCWP